MPSTKVSGNLFSGQTLYIGLDVHKKNWAVSIFSDHHELKTMSTDPNPDTLAKFLFRNYSDANFRAAYEAGFSGFGSCRQLKELGIDVWLSILLMCPPLTRKRFRKLIRLTAGN